MSKKQIDVYRTGIYLRLSQGDEDIDGLEKKESNSISNQKLLMEGFIDAHDDLKLVDIFIDDGYSGSNFDRPEFQRMMTSMKAGNLDCIIVKDLSRLARERIGADELIQKTFKKYNVRFIAVSEGYDSLTASSSETHTIILLLTFGFVHNQSEAFVRKLPVLMPALMKYRHMFYKNSPSSTSCTA